MKRWLFGLLIFPATLVIGYGLTQLFIFERPSSPTIESEKFGQQRIIRAAEELPDFIPEFRDLPNLEDTEYPDWDEHRLIDVFQIGGVYRESEVIAKSGETWLTLFERNGNYELKYSKASVKRLSTTSYAGDERDVRLTFDKPGVPILSVRNFKSLRPGKITSLYNRPSSDEIDRRNLPIGAMKDGYKQDFNLNETWYTLRVSRGVAKDGTNLGLLVLENEKQKQVIYSTQDFPGDTLIIGYLFWVGDLDRDGKLDVYLDPYDEKGGSGAHLFLSSEAETGTLVKLVARFGVAGC